MSVAARGRDPSARALLRHALPSSTEVSALEVPLDGGRRDVTLPRSLDLLTSLPQEEVHVFLFAAEVVDGDIPHLAVPETRPFRC
jgi:hypothetical protein